MEAEKVQPLTTFAQLHDPGLGVLEREPQFREDLAQRHKGALGLRSGPAHHDHIVRVADQNPGSALGPLPVKLTLGSTKTMDKNAIVLPVVAVLPMQRITLLPRDATLVGRVHVYLSVFDDNGRNVGFHHQLQEVTVANEQSKETPQNFRYTMNVRLKKGAFTVVITLRDELSNELGSAVQDVRL